MKRCDYELVASNYSNFMLDFFALKVAHAANTKIAAIGFLLGSESI
jgi:hypothetical protein